jgi:serine/threonine-protein kinase RsbT
VRPGALVIENEYDIVMARKAVRSASVECGFQLANVTRIVTAASELSRNIVLYAGCGTMTWGEAEGDSTGLEIVFTDHGPGIADLEQALRPGYTSGKGLGMGLPGSKRLMDEFHIESTVGEGTVVTIRKWLRG